MRNSTRSAVAAAALLAGAMSTPARAGEFFWRRAYAPPPPVHVYDLGGGPTWTSNGWSYPPVEIYYPSPAPYPAYRGPACDVVERHGGCPHRPTPLK
jgi:hypothetical protein